MQKISLLLLLFLFAISGFAQYSDGDVTIGMSTNFGNLAAGPEMVGFGFSSTTIEVPVDYSDATTTAKVDMYGANIAAKIGIGDADRLMFGLNVNLYYNTTLKNRFNYRKDVFVGSVSPFVRALIYSKNKLGFYIEGNAGLGIADSNFYNGGSSYFTLLGLTPGMSIKISERLLMDLAISYDYTKEQEEISSVNSDLSASTNSIAFEFGIIGVLSKKKKNEVN